MVIQHNIAALNSYRQLNHNNSAVSKNLEKLSSGYRINRAGDDAAGLAISEKMRAQITGLETAQKNAQDGISLVQTAEGALTEVHSMLNRMVDLATQSANGTYDNDVDRANIQKEVDSLKSEIDRISESSNYNGIKLLDGSLSGSSAAGGLTGASIAKYQGATTGAVAGLAVATSAPASYELNFTGGSITAMAADDTITFNGVTLKAVAATATAGTGEFNVGADKTATTKNLADAMKANIKFSNYEISADGEKITLTAKNPGEDLNSGNMGTVTASNTSTVPGISHTDGTGIDFFRKDTINIDGTDVSIDWSKLSDADKQILQKDWSATSTTVTADDAKKAAEVLQNTINSAIDSHNKANGTNLQAVKVTSERSATTNPTSFSFESGQKDGNSKISFEGKSGTVLGNVFVAGAHASAAPELTPNINPADVNGKFTMKIDDQTVEVSIAGLDASSTAEDVLNTLNASITEALANHDKAQGNTEDKDKLAGKLNVKFNADGALEFNNTTGKMIGFEDKNGGTVAKTLGISIEGKASATGGLVLQVGDTSDDFQKVTVKIDSMSSESLGIAGLNVKNQTGANAAIDKIKKAINTVSSTRGDLGAIQNRLDHTINNLSVTSENMTAAESRIRDVDMAKEMMDFTKNNILTQASQAMLAQANQIPQGVLQLLQ